MSTSDRAQKLVAKWERDGLVRFPAAANAALAAEDIAAALADTERANRLLTEERDTAVNRAAELLRAKDAEIARLLDEIADLQNNHVHVRHAHAAHTAGFREGIEAAAKIVAGVPYKHRYRQWPEVSGSGEGCHNRAEDSEFVRWCDRLAAAIRALQPPENQP